MSPVLVDLWVGSTILVEGPESLRPIFEFRLSISHVFGFDRWRRDMVLRIRLRRPVHLRKGA